MSISVGGGESYPGRSFSISQLLYAVKKKLQVTTLDGRCVWMVTVTGNTLLKTRVPQDCGCDEPGQGEAKRKEICFDAYTVTEGHHVSSCATLRRMC